MIDIDNLGSQVKISQIKWLIDWLITKMSANAKAINWVSLIIQRQNGVLIDVIGSHNGQIGKPGQVELEADTDKGVSGKSGQVGQISRINPDSKCLISQIIQSQSYSRKVQ